MQDENIHSLRFEQFFSGLLKEHGLTLKRLSEITGISVKHLEALVNGNFSGLPSSPYFHGYLNKLGGTLGFDASVWWAKFKEGGFVKDAGAQDSSPKNRFIEPQVKKILWIGAAAVALGLYFILRFTAIIGAPIVALTSPAINPAHASEATFDLAGTMKNGNDLYVNGERVEVSAGGAWTKAVLLTPGTNTVEIKAKKFLGGETKFLAAIVYDAPASTTSSTSPSGK